MNGLIEMRLTRKDEIQALAELFRKKDGDDEAAYRQMLIDIANTLPAVFRPEAGTLPALSEVRVEVRVTAHQVAHAQLDRLEQVLALPQRRWVLLGEPGAGKSTLLHDLILRILKVYVDPKAPLRDADHRLLPVLLRLAEIEEGTTLQAAVERDYTPASWPIVQRAIREERCLLLLDGLDEAAAKQRGQKVVRQLCAQAPDCRVIVTSRLTDYQSPAVGFGELKIQPLSLDSQRRLLLSWLKTPTGDVDMARVEAVLPRLHAQPRLAKMAGNPLLLTLIGLVLRRGGTLPERRTELYQDALQRLIHGEYRPDQADRLLEPEAAQPLFARAVLQLHGSVDPDVGEPNLWTMSCFVAALSQQGDACRRWGGPGALLKQVATCTGLIEHRAAGRSRAPCYLFAHRSFQEFLAAQAFKAAWRGTSEADHVEVSRVLRLALLSPAEWSEVLVLGCGLMSEAESDALVQRITQEYPAYFWGTHLATNKIELLLRVVAEAEGLSPATVQKAFQMDRTGKAWEKRKELFEQLPQLLKEPEVIIGVLRQLIRHTRNGNDLWFARVALQNLIKSTSEEPIRIEAQQLIDGIFDHMQDRVEEARQMVRWVEVPAGSFLMGSPKGKGDKDEHPRHRVTLTRRFQAMDAPVTHALYECFDPGHKADRYSFGRKLPEAQQDEVPVYNVTYYEAAMFAAWLGAWLPIEAEWEYLCRAGTTTDYHTGSGENAWRKAGWYDDNSEGHPHPVRQKTPNAWGLYDVHGNVWEWCADEYGDYQRQTVLLDSAKISVFTEISVALRVVRGGSWFNDASGARSAYRSGRRPDDRVVVLGFRLVRPLR